LFNKESKGVQAMIIVPSRELAIQIDDVFRKMQTGFKVTLCYGGHKREIEENNLLQAPALIIGTPGRIADHLRRNNFSADSITTLILDEFDKSLELGFQEEMEFIIKALKNVNKRLLTSATESVEVPDFIGLQEPQRLNYLNLLIENAIGIEIKTVLSEERDKINTLFKLICFLGNRSTIIFCNHREAVERTSALLADKGIINVFIMVVWSSRKGTAHFVNSGMALQIFGNYDLASCGLDIPNIRNIIHYHLPSSEDIFTHRNGRTARMTASGTVYVIYSEEEKYRNIF
jgi:superfamily II DNA/RNA helicase